MEFASIVSGLCRVQGGHKPGKPGILGDFSEHGKLGILCNLREKQTNSNKQSNFSLSFKYFCKTVVDWVNKIIRPLMKVIITFTFCCDNLWKSQFMALKKPGKLREFFSPIL